MADFTASYLPKIGDLAGFIVCAKSPAVAWNACACMMKTATGAAGVGLFTAALLETRPWLPVEEDGRLHDPVLRENFVERVLRCTN